MSFLQQSLLWGLLAASIPILIHLLNRKRHRTVQWAAMEFLLKVTRESRGKKKLKYLIILTCRALAIAALIFAISRPLIGGFFGWGSGKVDTVILILDRSSSMEQQASFADGITKESKRSSAIKSVQKSLSEIGNPRLILIDSASAKPQEIPSPDVLNEISATSATDTKANIPALISTAIEQISDKALGSTEIWVASDLQSSDWKPNQGSWDTVRTSINELPQKTVLRVLSLTKEAENNAAIRVTSSRRSGNEILLDIEILRLDKNYSSITLPITYNINGAESTDDITISGQSYQFQKRLKLTTNAAEGHGYISIPSDSNTNDNVSYFAYGEDAPTKTYLVTEGGESEKWLSLAAAPPGFGRSECTILTSDNAHEIDWLNASLIIWQANLPDQVLAQQLTSYLESGGAMLFFPNRGESSNTFLGLQWGEQTIAAKNQYFTVDEWNRVDGTLKNGEDGIQIPLPKLKAIKRKSIIGSGIPLASWADSSPFLVRKVIDDGTAVFVGSIPDYTWSNLADADVLLPIIQRMISTGDERFGSAFAAITGSSSAQIQEGEIRKRLDNYSTSISSNAVYESGVWRLGERTLATNRPRSEDQWQIISESQLSEILKDTPYKFFEDKGQSDSLAHEIWRPFLIAMLVLLIAEAVLCLQPASKKTKTS